jgi:hypothetical protein
LSTDRHDSKILNALAPFETANNKAYKPEYVAGFAAERYTLGLKDGWETAKKSITKKINSGVSGKILREHNADHVSDLKIKSTFNSITYKYLMLPIWVSSFQYKGKVYQFMVNGQTGKVYGKTPVSAGKVILVIVLCLLALAAFCACAGLVGNFSS